MSSLSPTELSNNLHRECEQILAKQNVNRSSLSSLDLHQLAFLALHALSDQHLIDEAKQMYNDTVLRALKQEYELISHEKNDLIQQIESNSVHSDELPLKENFTIITQTDDQEHDVSRENLQIIRDKLNRLVNERSELFPDSNTDPLEQFDRLLAVLDHQTVEIDQLKKQVPTSPSILRFVWKNVIEKSNDDRCF